MVEKVLIFVPMVAELLVCIGSAVLIYLLKHRSVEVDARVTGIEQKQKYYDSSRDKRLAYDYIYTYTDQKGNTLQGKLYRNVQQVEFCVNDPLPVRYLTDFPRLSFYTGSLPLLRYLPVMTGIMSLVFCLLLILI